MSKASNVSCSPCKTLWADLIWPKNAISMHILIITVFYYHHHHPSSGHQQRRTAFREWYKEVVIADKWILYLNKYRIIWIRNLVQVFYSTAMKIAIIFLIYVSAIKINNKKKGGADVSFQKQFTGNLKSQTFTYNLL